MNITINDELLDFQLDKEKKLSEVLNALHHFLSSQNHGLLSWKVNGESPEDHWEERPVTSVQSLELKTTNLLEREFADLQVTADFYVLLRQAILDKKDQVLLELAGEFHHLEPALDHILGLPFHKGFQMFVTETARFFQDFQRTQQIPDSLDFPEIIQTFLLEMDSVARGLENPQTFWDQQLGRKRELTAQLPEVSLLLSRHQDKQALDTILQLVNFLETTTYFLEMVRRFRLDFFPSIATTVQILTELNPFIQDIGSAMERKDYILVGDLLEYEVAPRLENLGNAS